MKQANVNTKTIQEDEGDSRFEGKTFVLTGSLEKYTREQAQELLQRSLDTRPFSLEASTLIC